MNFSVIDPRPYQSDFDMQMASIQTATAQLKLAEQEFLRAQELFRTKSTSAQQLDEATAKRDSAKGDLARAQSDLEQKKLYLNWTTVTAPFDGRMSNRLVNIGDLVNGSQGSATKLTRIVALDPIYLYFDVDERSMQRYLEQAEKTNHRKPDPANVRAVNIPVQFALASETGYPHEGVLDFIDTQIGKQNRNGEGPGDLSESRSSPAAWVFRPRPHSIGSSSSSNVGLSMCDRFGNRRFRMFMLSTRRESVILKPLTLGTRHQGLAKSFRAFPQRIKSSWTISKC